MIHRLFRKIWQCFTTLPLTRVRLSHIPQSHPGMLNLGCGKHFHLDWVNVDFTSTGKDVIAHNLNGGIPFACDSFDVIYHSHVLEHFSKEAGKEFIKECYRVLQTGGILRVVVPDLEQIVRIYLQKLEEKKCDDYDWMMLELFDQTVRNYSGGEMLKYITQDTICNKDFVISRIGSEAKNILNDKPSVTGSGSRKKKTRRFKQFTKRLLSLLKFENSKEKQIGRFRLGGEIHQWMYDRFSLTRLLKESGFNDIRVVSAFESNIDNFAKYQMDVLDNGEIRKPDSLFVECTK